MRKWKYIALVFILAWMSFIYFLSSQPGPVSNQLSKKVSQELVKAVKPSIETNIQATEKRKIYRIWNSKSRDYAHVTIFFVLSILCVVTLTLWNFKPKKAYIYSCLICLAYAGLDEFHQKFVPGRGTQWRDFGLDFLGIVLGMVTVFCIANLYVLLRQKRMNFKNQST